MKLPLELNFIANFWQLNEIKDSCGEAYFKNRISNDDIIIKLWQLCFYFRYSFAVY